MTHEARNYHLRESALYERLLADHEFMTLFMGDYIGRMRELQERQMATAHGNDLERCAARFLLLKEIQGHAADTVKQVQAMLKAEAEQAERLKAGLPVDDGG